VPTQPVGRMARFKKNRKARKGVFSIMNRTLLVVVLLIVTLLSNGGIALGKDDFTGKPDGTYFTGCYYISESETVIPVCSQLILGKGTIIRASNIAFLNYSGNSKTNPKYTTLISSDKNDTIVVLDEDMQVYLTDGGYICTVFNDTDKYLQVLKDRCDITPKMVIHMDNQKSQLIQLILSIFKD